MGILASTKIGLGAAALSVFACLAQAPVWAQVSLAPVPAGKAAAPQRDIRQWLERLHEAARERAYIGTFVVTTGDEIAASKIWHVCDGTQQMERIETLTGASRTILRHNDEVLTFVPALKVAVREKREGLRLFPGFLDTPANHIADHYRAQWVGSDRVAGFNADVVDFIAQDARRFGYRVWAEQQTGLVVKLQTRKADGHVLEQVAFTELQLDAPVRMEVLARQMSQTDGYREQQVVLQKTTPEAQGWRMKPEMAGFQATGCHTRIDGTVPGGPVMQCVFSDGMASVSLFVETFDPQRHTKEKTTAVGATHSVTQRLGDHWVTVMGEVPAETLRLFTRDLERRR